jgi:hypothetical protein
VFATPVARPVVQPPAVTGGGLTIAAPRSVNRVLSGCGNPLEPGVRQYFEHHFGHDFSRVRVHVGPAAAQSAHDIDARAYTVGQDIVFGTGQYAPHTPAGRHVLAHELTHVVQQSGAARGQAVARLQRFGLSDVLELGAEVTIGPVGGALVRSEKQFLDDLVASVRESPQHVLEFFKNEVWEQIKAHWLRITLVTTGLLLAEELVAALTAVPEPTLLTKVVAAILQIVIIAVLGYFAAVEVGGAYDEGRRWLTTARQAHGRAEMISEASRAFVRMVWHIVMAVLAVAGVRARIRGLAPPGAGGAPAGGAAPSSGGASGAGGEGGELVPIASHPRFQPRTGPQPTQPRAAAFGPGGTARQLAPAEAPQLEPPPQPVPNVPQPAAARVTPTSASTTPGAGPGVQAGPAVAAGLSSATKRPPFVLRLPMEKAPHLGTYRAWLGRLQSDPSYTRGSPAQLDKWHQAHRIGGSHAIPAEVYERGHALGLTGEPGERRVRVPDWSRTRSTPMEVDHIIELQVAPGSLRDAFDHVDNYELLDRTANGNAGRQLQRNIAAERAIQVAFDPSAAKRVLIFDQVELDGGQPGERWRSEEIRRGDQLDAYRGPAPTTP